MVWSKSSYPIGRSLIDNRKSFFPSPRKWLNSSTNAYSLLFWPLQGFGCKCVRLHTQLTRNSNVQLAVKKLRKHCIPISFLLGVIINAYPFTVPDLSRRPGSNDYELNALVVTLLIKLSTVCWTLPNGVLAVRFWFVRSRTADRHQSTSVIDDFSLGGLRTTKALNMTCRSRLLDIGNQYKNLQFTKLFVTWHQRSTRQ